MWLWVSKVKPSSNWFHLHWSATLLLYFLFLILISTFLSFFVYSPLFSILLLSSLVRIEFIWNTCRKWFCPSSHCRFWRCDWLWGRTLWPEPKTAWPRLWHRSTRGSVLHPGTAHVMWFAPLRHTGQNEDSFKTDVLKHAKEEKKQKGKCCNLTYVFTIWIVFSENAGASLCGFTFHGLKNKTRRFVRWSSDLVVIVRICS